VSSQGVCVKIHARGNRSSTSVTSDEGYGIPQFRAYHDPKQSLFCLGVLDRAKRLGERAPTNEIGHGQ